MYNLPDPKVYQDFDQVLYDDSDIFDIVEDIEYDDYECNPSDYDYE